MSKNYISLVFLLFVNTIFYAQKVTITPLTVNNKSVISTNPINLESVDRSTVSLSVKIDSPIPVGNEGTLSILFAKDPVISPVVTEGGFERVTNFIGGNSATVSFIIVLNLSSFNATGGFIQAQYKSNSGLIYKSANISVIKNGSTPTTPPVTPTNPNFKNTLCCDQIVRYGDKPAPIVGSALVPGSVSVSWLQIDDSQFPNKTYTGHNYSSDKTNILVTDYLTENATFKRRLGNDFPFNVSNAVNIRIVPSPITNEISVLEGGPNSDGFIEIMDSNPKQIGSGRGREVNLNILQDPNHITQRGDSYDSVERYEWQYARTNQEDNIKAKNWINIENGNASILDYFTPSNLSDTDDNYFVLRRIAIYKNISRVSNSLKIIPRKVSFNNMICCDQILGLDTTLKTIEKPSLITGSIPSIENLNKDGKKYTLSSITYQWQSQSISNTTRPNVYGTWTNIAGATSKDYLPNPLQFTVGTRGGLVVETTYNYRRIATINYHGIINGSLQQVSTKSYSNEINVKSGRFYGPVTLIAYPNPASTTINIENKDESFILSNTKISIANTMGTIVNSNNFSVVSPNVVSIDVSNLTLGTYFINVDTGTGSRGNKQLTFIKSN
jgi:hypothetical protein